MCARRYRDFHLYETYAHAQNIALLDYNTKTDECAVIFEVSFSLSVTQFTKQMELTEGEDKRGRVIQENNNRNRPETLSESMIALLKWMAGRVSE